MRFTKRKSRLIRDDYSSVSKAQYIGSMLLITGFAMCMESGIYLMLESNHRDNDAEIRRMEQRINQDTDKEKSDYERQKHEHSGRAGKRV